MSPAVGPPPRLLACCLALLIPGALAAAEKFEVVVERNVMVPMRDGVRLATDIYLPRPAAGELSKGARPAVLMRTPYDRKAAFVDHVRYFAEHGFMAVTQDTRGRFASEGNFAPFRQEPEDGYDTIEWVAHHKACNGKVGMYGVSYMAWVQYEAATQSPPSLKTMAPHCGPTNGYFHIAHIGGTSMLTLLKWHVDMAASSKEAKANPKIARALTEMNGAEEFMRWAAAIPWRRGQTPLALTPHYEDATFKMFFDYPDYGPFWRQAGLGMDEHFDKFPDVPTLSIIGWYEIYPRSIINSFDKFTRHKRGPHYLVAGPWTHANTRPSAGDANFGKAASEIPGIGSYLELHRRWFNRFLKGDQSAELGAKVKMFVLRRRRRPPRRRGPHQPWRPLADRQHLAPGRIAPRAVLPAGRGGTRPGSAEAGFLFHQLHLRPAKYGLQRLSLRDRLRAGNQQRLRGHGPGRPDPAPHAAGTRHARHADRQPRRRARLSDCTARTRPDDRRQHQSAAVDSPPTPPDTDFYLKLIDVYPPSEDYPLGYAFPLTDGMLRARYRESFEHPKLLSPGKVYEISLPLQPTANLFRKGHRIRLDVTSSCFPSFDINRNTGDPRDRRWRLANNTVYHEAAHASYLELPVMH